MARHLARRLAGTGLVLLVVSFVIFCALDFTPGDAAQALVGDSASQQQLDALRHKMGLDVPLIPRYMHFLRDLVTRGDLGRSFISGRAVSDLLRVTLPHTLLLALVTISCATLIGLVIGLLAAVHAGGYLDTAIMGTTTLGMAVPTFWSGLLLMMLFSLKLGWLPVVGGGGIEDLILPPACWRSLAPIMCARPGPRGWRPGGCSRGTCCAIA
jgi:peptide/nickel transport system permease protein